MLNKPVYLTEHGFGKLSVDLQTLLNTKRPALLQQLQEIQGGGDWMDNADDVSIREELAFVDGRIEELQYMLEHAQLLTLGQMTGQIDVGSTAVIQEEGGSAERYVIVGAAEANPSKGLISNESPLGKALLKHKVGDEICVKVPDGELHFQVLAVS